MSPSELLLESTPESGNDESHQPNLIHYRRVLDVDRRGRALLGMKPSSRRPHLRITTLLTPAADGVVRQRPPTGGEVRGRLESLPFVDASFDLVAVSGTLEHLVADDTAIDEVARVLQPGGLLFLRVPRDGRLAWLDAQNLYTYVSGTTHRGKPLAGRPILRFRRHYGRQELVDLLREHGLRVHALTTEGLGIGESLTLATLLTFRWLFRSERGEQAARSALAPILKAERRLRAGRFGRDILVVAEKWSDPAGQASSAKTDRPSVDS